MLIALTVAVPLVFYIQVLFGMLGLAFEYRADAQRTAPRVARLQGLLEQRDLVLARSNEAQRELAALAYPALEDPSALAATLQAEVRQRLAEAGLSVSNSQVLPTRSEEQFDRVAIKLTASGSLPALDAALIGIAAMRPQLLVESLDVFPARSQRRNSEGEEPQNLTLVIQLLALRLSA
jgi:general secretion pathway protein M